MTMFSFRRSERFRAKFNLLIALGLAFVTSARNVSFAGEPRRTTVRVTVDRGPDIGQNFGTLFEATSADGSLNLGAGFANAYNTRLRADRHELTFWVRPTEGLREIRTEKLPRPNDLCGTYLYARDGAVYSTFGGLKRWNQATNAWEASPDVGGTHETMRVGNGVLAFGDSEATYDARTILPRPERGSYQLFYYADGYLCFYHVDRGEGGYRAFANEADGFSKLYACPWSPAEPTVDLSKAMVLTLPVVGETTFAWGSAGGKIVTGSNIGGFYVFENGRWRILLEPNIKVSYQLYSSMAYDDNLWMGQYPTGRIFAFDGRSIADQPGFPPVLPGVSSSAREAQSTTLFGGEAFVGVWPWGELWRYHPSKKNWTFARRMFDHPELSEKIVHPYDVENSGDAVPNQWGQRVTSLVTSGTSLFVATSAKDPCVWTQERAPFLGPDKWKSYGAVYRLTMPGHLGASTAWTDGPTVFELTIQGSTMSIVQDGKTLAQTTVDRASGDKLRVLSGLKDVRWGKGLYGSFAGKSLKGEIAP